MTIKKPLAIIGMGCRFPGGADDPASYWRMLCDGVDAMRDIPRDRWDVDRFYDADPDKPGKTYMRQGAFLTQPIDRFDAAFFGISPREAAFVDPQQRLLLELVWEALEEAAIAPSRLAGSSTGVFVGAFALDSLVSEMQSTNRALATSHAATGSSLAILANRISYLFDFQGPSIAVDTACSTSLVAIHLACQSLWNGETELAVAGGVNRIFRPEYAMVMSKGRFLSPDWRCKAFDESANGYARGEGAGVVLIKRLEDAERDGDPIRALILSTAVNQDGRTPGISMPSPNAQEALLREAYGRAGIAPGEVGYVEAHGTGTAVGDPIETNALGKVLGEGRDPAKPLWIGSVKTNIGHLEAAAGVAGLMKAVLCLENEKIPPHLHLKNPNPRIRFEELKLRVPRALERWDMGDGPAYAGVNSFGYGGTNAHVVLGRAPQKAEKKVGKRAPSTESHVSQPKLRVLPLAARSKEALSALAKAYSELPALNEPGAKTLRDLCHSASLRETRLDHRAAFVAREPQELRRQLAAFAAGTASEGVYAGRAPEDNLRAVFVYTGMGPQWWGMARELFHAEPVFREKVEEIDRIFRSLTHEWRLIDELMRDEATSRIGRTELAQTTNFAVQAGLTDLLRSWGIEPAAIVGHSVGEVSAAYASGALSLEDAALVSFHRSRVQARAAGKGRMLATDLTNDQAREMLAGYGDRASIAAVNGPSSLTLSGDADALEEIAKKLEEKGRFNRFLQVEVPYHSRHMDPLREDLEASLRSLKPQMPKVLLISTVTGQDAAGTFFDAGYWWRNIRQPVEFAEAMYRLIEHDFGLYLEVGPHPVLGASIAQCLRARGRTGASLQTLYRKKPDLPTLFETVSKLYTLGYPVDWKKLNPSGERLSLPHYPWQREYHWSESAASIADRRGAEGDPLLGLSAEAPQSARTVELHGPVFPFLSDHRIEGNEIFPGAAYVEAALALGMETLGVDSGVLEEVEFHKALVIDPDRPAPSLYLTFDKARGQLTIYSHGQESDAPWTLHATGKFIAEKVLEPEPRPVKLSLDELRARVRGEIPVTDFYTSLRERGLEYGPCFQSVRRVGCSNDEVLAVVELPERLKADAEHYRLHPVLLDGALQSFAAILLEGGSGLVLPVGMERLRYRAKATGPVWVHGRITERATRGVTGDITLMADDGTVLAEVRGMRFQLVASEPAGQAERQVSWLYDFVWRESQRPNTPRAISPLVVMDGGCFGKTLIERLSARGVTGKSLEAGATLEKIDPCFSDIVYLAGLDGPSPGDVSEDSRRRTVDAGAGLLSLFKVAAGEAHRPRIWIVTRGANSIAGSDAAQATASALWGLARVAAVEHPDLRPTLVDLDTTASSAVAPRAELQNEDIDRLADELLTADRETEIGYRGGKRYVRRMERLVLPAEVESDQPSADDTTPFRLESTRRGSFDSLVFRREERRPPGPGEVTLHVRSVALNFKDVLKAMGVLSERIVEGTMSRETLGLECAGTIAQVGEGVTDFRPGDDVVATAPGCFRSYLTAPAKLVFKKLPQLSFEQEAALPVVFLTAYYSLKEIARLKKGERVLIHAATGGVGLAAIQVARWIGAEIFATAGSAKKRDYLKSLGIQHVMNSRSLEFADQIREMTGGRGVDVVLNSLTGEALLKSVGALAPYGRFIEIGKRDIDENNPLGLRPFNRNLMFAAIDIDRLIHDRPDEALGYMREIRTLFASGTFSPLPTEVFPAAKAGEAFRHLAQAKHIGKVVIDLSPQGIKLAPSAPPELKLESQASYLITGGLGGVGSKLASWLADHGARHLVLVGRKGAQTEESQRLVRRLERKGIQVKAAAADVGRMDSLKALLDEVAREMPPLRGVFHAAMVLDDEFIVRMDKDRYEKVLAPKMFGAMNLHALTEGMPLDHFVMFSSIVGEIGNVGQASYAAANAFLDALAAYRRSRGLSALAIDYGALAEVGVVARNERLQAHLERQGWHGIPVRQALDAMGRLLNRPAGQMPPVAVVADIAWSAWKRAYPIIGSSPLLSDLMAETGGAVSTAAAEATWRDRILKTEPEKRQACAEGFVASAVAKVLGASPEKIDVNRRLDEMGVDSLMAVELQDTLNAQTGVELTAMDLMQGRSIARLAAFVLSRIVAEEEPKQAA